jgi:CheY-like chemotaxis protein/anti-sigma regulatory factor (Ser/Thr protein kinase)
MVSILVVDDSAVDRRLAGGLLAKQDGWLVQYASGGKEAAGWLRSNLVDAVVTDLQMPEMNGLEFVRHMKSEHPLIPVILMTGQGSEDIAVEALERGAASYVPKRLLASDLVETVERVLTLAGEKRVRRSLISRMHSLRTQFVLENDPAMLTSMVSYFQGLIVDMGIFTESERLKIGVALEEALLNAAYHGNLEVSSKLREEDHAQFYNLAKERRSLDPYQSRRIFVDVDLSSQGVQYVIRDEGPGFDPHSQPDPRDPANLERPCGRGLLLMRTFMDVVEYNPTGNQVTLIKRSSSRTAPSLAD